MELIYSMRRKPLKCEPPLFDRASDYEATRPICTISVCNIIAFSSPTELLDTDGDTWGGHVYVCDLDTPWNSHKVTSTAHPVSVLEWDCEGKQLLVGTTEGEISVYGQKDYLLNEWNCLYSVHYPGEQIIKCVFFHNGRRFACWEKKPDAPISDRIQMLRSAPTLKGFGGVACEGMVFITATGLVGAVTPPAEDGSPPTVATETLRSKRDHVVNASFAHKNGNILVAALCLVAGGNCAARCGIIGASLPPCSAKLQRHSIAIQPLPTVYLNEATPSCVSWWVREDAEFLIVGGGASVGLWKLTERTQTVHKLFNKGPLQGSTTPGGGQKPGSEGYSTLSWHQCVSWKSEGVGGCAVGCGRGPMTSHAVLTTGNKIHLLARDSHHYLCTRPIITSGVAGGDGPEPKKAKYGHGNVPMGSDCAVSCCVEVSWLGGVCVVIDTHAQLHVYRMPYKHQEIPPALQVQHAVTLLEYALVTGYDFLDVLLTLKQNIVEPVYERLTETFNRQPPAFQQYYYQNWLRIRVALCRISSNPSAGNSVSALTCLQMLHECWASCLGACRLDDKPDTSQLAAITDDTLHHSDTDKALSALESKPDLGVEALSLAALRRPLRRAADVTASMLVAMHTHASTAHHGYDLHTDPSAILLLRKLLVLARGTGACLDPTLSRMLNRLSMGPPKQDLVEECSALSAQMSWSGVWEALPRCTVSAPHNKHPPLFLEYGTEPESLRVSFEPPSVLADAANRPNMDSIRYMYMGGGWCRCCGRCGCRALPKLITTKQPLQRAHDLRMATRCRCGGKWTLSSNI